MNIFGKAVAACAFACVALVARADFVVVDNGRPTAVVCVAGNASSAARFAAKEIAKYVEAMTGAKLKVIVGRAVGGARIEIDDAAKGLGREEFRIETKGGVLSLSGGSPRAALYAAYELLEHFGCGFWSPFNETVPSAKSLSVESTWKVQSKPAIPWRQVHSQYGYKIKWKPKLRINGRMWTDATPPELGGSDSMSMGQSLAGINNGDAEKRLFAEHPDWFAWREKEKTRTMRQMCTSNDEVVDAIIAKIRSRYKTNPSNTSYESVSLRDNDKICQCDKCRRLVKKHDSTAAPIFDCANRVAKAIAKDLPNVRIVVLAYWVSQTPPKGMSLEPNVTVCWARLRNFAVPPSKVPGHDAKLNKWRELAKGNVVIWDYNTQFRGYLLPTPIIDMMGPGFREYAKKEIKGVMVQMAGFGAALMDFAELRTWLCAKLLWNPEQDEHELMRKWCDGACGAGSAAVKEWLEIRRKARDRKRSYGPYDPDSLKVFTPKELVKGYVLMQGALKATEGDARTHAQVRRISLAPLTAVICNYNRGVLVAAKAEKITLPPRDKLVDEFEAICAEYKVRSFGQGMPSIAEFIKLMREGGELLKKPK